MMIGCGEKEPLQSILVGLETATHWCFSNVTDTITQFMVRCIANVMMNFRDIFTEIVPQFCRQTTLPYITVGQYKYIPRPIL